jgi:hypothetical protein
MGFWSSVSSCVSSVCSAIGSAFSSVGSVVAGGAAALFSPFKKLEMAINIIQVIGVIVSGIAEMLGLKPNEETPEELGAKAQEAEKKLENFESTEKYIEYLRNEVKLDKEKFENMSAVEKSMCTAVGVSLYSKNIEEKTGITLSPEFLIKAGQLHMNSKEVKAYMDSFKENGFTNMKYMGDFLTGRLDEKTDLKVESAIAQGFKTINPNISESDIQLKLGDMREKALNTEGN